MSSEWNRKRIGDVGRVITGKTPSTSNSANFDGPYPFITIPDLNQGRYVRKAERSISECGANTLRSCLLPANAVLMSCIATIGKCGITTRPSFTNQQINSVICGPDILPSYLYYVFTQLGGELNAAGGGGSVYTNVSKSRFSDIEIPIPTIREQTEISDFLGALDDRISLLRETNQTLEAIAQALFKSWFVDFDPVRARAQGKLPEGMDAATAALFPDTFDETELGLVPRGWAAIPFRETIDVIGGGTPKTSVPEYWGGSIPWFSVVDAPVASNVFVIDTEKHITEAGLNGSSTKLLQEGTTIISARGTVGRLALTGCPMTMNQSCYGLRGKAGDQYFTYFSTARLVHQLKQQAHGSVFDTITKETFAGVSICYPSSKVIAEFERLTSPLMLRIRECLFQMHSLSNLRDTLLPRLISGQLRIAETELEKAMA